VTLEEIVAAPRAGVQHYPRGALPTRVRGEAVISSLLPDKIPGMLIERIELPPGGRLVGVPHTPGTREYLTCEAGVIELVASGEAWRVDKGDLVVFRGDQRHSYSNPTRGTSVGYSIVILEPVR
jgi:quercetin dioxygenase-like cupin family protein